MSKTDLKKIHVGLIFGGRSGEHEVSLASAMSIYSALDKSRYDVTLIGIDKGGRWLLPNTKDVLQIAEQNPMALKLQAEGTGYGVFPYAADRQLVASDDRASHFDVILPILHGTYGEDGTIQGLLELMQVPYVGSGVLGSAVGMDKEVANRLFQAAGIRTIPSLSFRKHEFTKDPASVARRVWNEFEAPVFVKPANAGSSVGVHKVKSQAGLSEALEDAFSYDTKVLVQKSIAARELEVAILGNHDPKASVVGEIVPRHEFYSYEAKYLDEHGADLHIPAQGVSEAALQKVRDWAVQAFLAIECRGMARVDFFLDRQTEEVYLNEINTIPGFTRISMYPKLWEASGIKYPALLDELIRLAIETFQERNQLKTERR